MLIHILHHNKLHSIFFYLKDEGQSYRRFSIWVFRAPFIGEEYRWEIFFLRLQLQKSDCYKAKKNSQCQNVASFWNPWSAIVPSMSNGSHFVSTFNYPIPNLKVSFVISHTPRKEHSQIHIAILTKQNSRMGLCWPFNHANLLSLISYPFTWTFSDGESTSSTVKSFHSWNRFYLHPSPSLGALQKMVTNCSSSLLGF